LATPAYSGDLCRHFVATVGVFKRIPKNKGAGLSAAPSSIGANAEI